MSCKRALNGNEHNVAASPSSKRQKVLYNGLDDEVDDTRIANYGPLLPPHCLLEEMPLNPGTKQIVMGGRQAIRNILEGRDDRIFAVVGPCSVHDTKAAKEYALQLRNLRMELQADVEVIMRVYFEKPRTTVGWKGLINDPDLDGTFKINKGLRMARALLLQINELGVPCGCEFLDTISPQWTGDTVSWGAIGARTTESQCHRELASGISAPVGFKNGTSGDIKVAADACMSASNPHSFLSVTKQGLAAIVHTTGNPHCHVILRGGKAGTNYSAEHIAKAEKVINASGQVPKLVVDCSHGNSLKVHTNQPKVAASVAEQIAAGSNTITGVMIESNLNEGNQKLKPGHTILSNLQYGVSVTDACINIETTAEVLRGLAAAVQERRKRRAAQQ